MKTINIIISLVFSLFAIVQYNDPDPWLWIAFYSFIALISAIAATGKYHKWLLLVGLGIASIWMLSLVPDFIHWIKIGMPTIASSMKAEAPHIELTREFFGLLLCIFTLLFHYKQFKSRSHSSIKGEL